MEIGNLASSATNAQDSAVITVLEKLVTKIDGLVNNGPALAAVGQSASPFGSKGGAGLKGKPTGAGGKGGDGTLKCFKCGGPHLARNCPNQNVPFWKQGKGNGPTQGKPPQNGVGGNPNSKVLCRNYAQTGKCRFGDQCKFKHVYGTLGCLAGIAMQARATDMQIPAALIPDDCVTWDDEHKGYCLGADKELEVCCNLASEAEILTPEDIAEMKAACLEASGFQGQPVVRK